jgi:hypothetical protein
MASNETIVERESIFITLLALGRVYPSDDPNGVRGVRKSDRITVSLRWHIENVKLPELKAKMKKSRDSFYRQ